MRLRWTAGALSDLTRLHAFLATVNERAAARAVQKHLPIIQEYQRREVRRTLVAQYELRYEIADDEIIILRLWHTRGLR